MPPCPNAPANTSATASTANWDRYSPRAGDVVVSTSYSRAPPGCRTACAGSCSRTSRGRRSRRSRPGSTAQRRHRQGVARLEAQEHRPSSRATCRSMPWPRSRRCYIVVVRDPRDIFMSFWNHIAMTMLHRRDEATRLTARRCRVAGRHPRDLGAVDRPRLVRVGKRGLAALRRPLPHGPGGGSATWSTSFSSSSPTCGRPAGRDRPRRGAPRHRVAEERREIAGRSLRGDPQGHRAAGADARRRSAIWGGPRHLLFQGPDGRWREVLTPTSSRCTSAPRPGACPRVAAYLERGRAATTPTAAA